MIIGSFTQNLVVNKGNKGVVVERINAGDCYMRWSINRYKYIRDIYINRYPDSADITGYIIDDKDIWKRNFS